MWNTWDQDGRQLMFHAQSRALMEKATFVEPEHLLLAFTDLPSCKAMKMLEAAQLTAAALSESLESKTPKEALRPGDVTLGPRSKAVIEGAYLAAKARQDDHLGTEHILLAIVKEKTSPAAVFLIESGANLAKLQEALGQIQ